MKCPHTKIQIKIRNNEPRKCVWMGRSGLGRTSSYVPNPPQVCSIFPVTSVGWLVCLFVCLSFFHVNLILFTFPSFRNLFEYFSFFPQHNHEQCRSRACRIWHWIVCSFFYFIAMSYLYVCVVVLWRPNTWYISINRINSPHWHCCERGGCGRVERIVKSEKHTLTRRMGR